MSCLFLQAGAQTVVRDSLDFSKASARTFLNMLEGQVSGLNVTATDGNINSALNLYIRGLNAVHSDSQPLVVVDGVILTSSLNQNLDAFYDKDQASYTSPLDNFGFLSTYEVEKIEVLNDISATNMYGSKAANGVILVTTKRPSLEGRKLDFRSNYFVEIQGTGGYGFSPAFSHNHSLGLSSCKKGRMISVSGFFRGQSGVVHKTGSNAGGLSIKFETRANPYVWFSFSSHTGVTGQSSSAGAAYLGTSSRMLVTRYPELFPDESIAGWKADYDDKVVDYRSVNTAVLTLNPAKGLSINASVGADFDSNQRNIWYGNGTAFGKANNGAASILESTLFNYNAMLDINYGRFFSTRHRFDVKAYVEADGNANKMNAMCGYDFFVHDLRGKSISIMGSDKKLNKFQRSYNEIGAGLKASYSYDGIVGADLALALGYTAKYDGKPSLYPSANLFFDLHKAFFRESGTVSSLKLSAGYGAAGREYYIPYELTGNYYTGLYPSVNRGAEPYYESLNRLRTEEWNAGLSMGFLGDRLLFSLKYYDKTTADKFSMFCFGAYSEEAKLWAYTDRSQVFANTELLRNRGFEMEFNARILSGSLCDWTLGLNAAFNVNQITGTDGSNVRGWNIGGGTFVNANMLGYSVSSLFGYEEDGLGGYKDNFKDGVIDEMDKVILGNAIPKYIGSLYSTVRIGNWYIDILARLSGGNKIANLNRMIADGKTDLSETYIESGTYARLSRLAVSYEFKFNSKHVKSLRLNLSGNNLFTLTSYSGWNPDVNCFGWTALSYGVDYGSYPAVRTVMLGISVDF